MSEDRLTFSRLRLQGWRQFDTIDIELHKTLTILTGANGAGKTSLLHIFSRHFGLHRQYLSTPKRDKSGKIFHLPGIFHTGLAAIFGWSRVSSEPVEQVGELTYSNGVSTPLTIPRTIGIQYALSLPSQQAVAGVPVDAYQAASQYQTIPQIPMDAITAEVAYNNYSNEMNTRSQGGHSSYSPVFRLKEALISMALLGEGNKYVPGNADTLSVYEGFIDVLKQILPETLGFQTLAIRPPEVVLVTSTGEFLIDAASGGVTVLIDLAWRLHTFSRLNKRFVVTMDEPENHLHPSMQRSLMGRLTKAFPEVQFIVATHSPFIVSSVKDSSVYVLRYRLEGRDVEGFVPETSSSRVVSEKLDLMTRAGTANEILREVLGVPATMPEWAEASLAQIVEEYRQRPVTSEMLAELRGRLQQEGFDEYYSQVLAGAVKK